MSKVVEPGYVLKPVSLRNSCFLGTYVSSPKTGTLRLKRSRPCKSFLKPKGNSGIDSWRRKERAEFWKCLWRRGTKGREALGKGWGKEETSKYRRHRLPSKTKAIKMNDVLENLLSLIHQRRAYLNLLSIQRMMIPEGEILCALCQGPGCCGSQPSLPQMGSVLRTRWRWVCCWAPGT